MRPVLAGLVLLSFLVRKLLSGSPSEFALLKSHPEEPFFGVQLADRNPDSLAEAIDRLVLDFEAARRMGESGRRAIIERYNWPAEEKKLLGAYSTLLGEAA